MPQAICSPGRRSLKFPDKAMRNISAIAITYSIAFFTLRPGPRPGLWPRKSLVMSSVTNNTNIQRMIRPLGSTSLRGAAKHESFAPRLQHHSLGNTHRLQQQGKRCQVGETGQYDPASSEYFRPYGVDDEGAG